MPFDVIVSRSVRESAKFLQTAQQTIDSQKVVHANLKWEILPIQEDLSKQKAELERRKADLARRERRYKMKKRKMRRLLRDMVCFGLGSNVYHKFSNHWGHPSTRATRK